MNLFWILIFLSQWISRALCDRAANKSIKDFFAAANLELEQSAVNCTSYIPARWRQLMQEHEPADPSSGHQLDVSEEYLVECLHGELKRKNRTSPFSYSPRNYLLYNIVLREVVSLGFDGILLTQASSLLYRAFFLLIRSTCTRTVYRLLLYFCKFI